MDATSMDGRLRQAVGIFHDVGSLEATLHDLAANGFDPSAITVVAAQATLEKLDLLNGKPDSGMTPREPHRSRAGEEPRRVGAFPMRFIEIGVTEQSGPLLASSGEWAQQLVQWANDADRRFGCFLEHKLEEAHSRFLRRQIATGATTLWVRVHDGEEEKRACRSLLRNSGNRVQVHDIGLTRR